MRTTGPKDVYTATIQIPAWMRAPFRVYVQNGEPDGTFRISSATVEINGVAILTQSDFNQNAASYERAVTLANPSTLKVTLASKPTSYLTLWLYGTVADYSKPQLVWSAPPNESTVNTATPQLRVRYADAVGVDEPAASGVDLASLKVFIDDVDRSELFTRRSDEASADIPADAPLTEGVHAFKASIADRAANRTEVTGTFRVDLTPPAIQFTQPAAGAYLPTRTPAVTVQYTDDVALDVPSLSVQVNGATLPETSIVASPTEAAITVDPLPEGPNQIVATIRDAGGNATTASIAFNVDVTPPALIIAQPQEGARSGSRDVPVTLTFTDEQGIAESSVAATIDGTSIALTTASGQSTGQLTALADGAHTVVATVADLAGNTTTATSTFTVDVTLPTISVIQPPAGANTNDSTPDVEIRYSDEQGVVTDSLIVNINQVDQTTLFTITADTATATIPAPLPEGTNEIAAQIRDLTGNVGATVSSFLVDTVAPTGTITAPTALVNSATPVITVEYADSGSGIDPATVALTLDGAATTGVLVAGPESASGAPAALADGEHAIDVTFADRAGNATTLSRTFVVDTVAPVLSIDAPANDSFVRTTTPAIITQFSDAGGTGVDVASVRLVLRRGDDPEIDVTSYVTITTGDARGIVPSTAPLADGTYHLRVEVRDLAGNLTTTESAFEVDTLAPTYVIEAPAANGYVATATPAFVIRWSDALSGVDITRAAVAVDGIDRTALFTFTADGATATFTNDEALADGRHLIELVLFDRAGNQAPPAPQYFTVDTVNPVAAIEQPADGSFIAAAPHAFAIVYGDGDGDGVDPATVHITIDGIDRTAEFTVGATSATAQIATPLADGSHTVDISVLDWAANPASATSTFTVDSIAPVVTITAPAAGAWIKDAAVTVAGTVVDATPVTLEINDLPFVVSEGAFTASVPTTDGSFTIRAIARDAAANQGTTEVIINVDTLLPVITVTEPVDGLITAATSVRLAGSVADASAVTMTLDGQPLPLTDNAFSIDVPLAADGPKVITLVATDAGGNAATKTLTVTRDTIAPSITVASPAASSAVGTTPVVVRGTLDDATATTITVDGVSATISGSAWEASIDNLADGPHTFSIVATDAANNTTTLSHAITLDTLAPVVTITTPVNGALTKLPTTSITGTVTDGTLQSVASNGITATLADGSSANEKLFTIDGVALNEGDNSLVVVATDALGRTGQATVIVTRDSTPPAVTLEAPELITRTRATNVTADVQDNLAIRDVVFTLDGATLATLTAPPFVVAVIAPATSSPGDVLALTVIATDTAGNSTIITRSLRVTSDGAVIGQVLSDANGLPLPGARVRVAGGVVETMTDERGRYALPANDQNLVLVVDRTDLMTTVERTVAIESAVGTVPVDARLTPLATKKTMGSNGGIVGDETLSVTIPSGALPSSTPVRLTRLSSQGLPNLLPLGWSSVAAFDFRIEGEVASVPFAAHIGGITVDPLVLVRYSTSVHAWTVVTTGVGATGGAADVTLPEPGSYALVIADDANVPAAVVGEVLRGVDVQPIGEQATSTGSVNPPTLPPTGGSATGTLVVHSPSPLPSGTVVQAEVTETFSLTTGEEASSETRTQDIVLYRAPQGGTDVSASFPIVPSRTFTTGDLEEGKVHLDILAGRESVRGRTGGSQALGLEAGDVTVTIPAGSLPQDLAIAATPVILSSFLPSTSSALPFAEVVLDFGGATLGTSAVLAVRASAVPPGETVVLARVERVRGVPKVVVVATTQLDGDRFVTIDSAGFEGIRRDGRYVFYRINVAWGIVTGEVGVASAVVTTDGFPFVALSDAQGSFTTIAMSGMRTVSATVPGTSLTGQTAVSVPAGGATAASFTLAATETTAVVTPENGAIRVPTSVQVEIAASAPLDQQTANSGTVSLRSEGGTNVPVRHVFSGSGRILAVIPQTALDAGVTYRLTVDGLTDIFGGRVNVAEVSFTTAPDEPPQYDTNAIVFSMPDSGGMITISAPAGSLPPGTTIIVVNTGNGVVASFTVGNDGSFSGRMPATIDDKLLVTVTDPQGNVVNFERSKFVFSDGSGRVAIGTGGGTVEGPGGVELRIPEGALESGAVFKVEALGPDAFPERPTLPGATFGSALRITSEQMPKLKREGDLVFPRPADAPEGAFFYVYRRMTGPNGQVAFETVDHAFDDGHGKVVTASYPFIGWSDSASAWQTSADLGGLGFGLAQQVIFTMMWTFDAMLPGLPLPGAIIGKVYRPVWKAGATEPEYEPVPNAMVQAVSGSPDITNFARSGGDGTFSLFDPAYRGGPVEVEARGPEADDYVRGTAFQANPANTRSNAFAAIEKLYGYAAEINFTFPATSQPRVSAVRTHVMKLDAQGMRQDAGGIVVAGVPLIIGFKFEDATAQPFLQNANILGEEIPVRADTTSDPLRMDFVLADEYTPAQPGSYTVRATAIPPLGGSPLTISHTFLVVAAGGSNATTLNGTAPDIVTDLVDPRPDSIGNATSVFPTVVFTEPVKHVAANVHLLEAGGGDVAVVISAIGVDAQGNQQVIADLAAQSPETAITSITIQPRSALKFDTQYTIRLDGGIIDLDKTAEGADDPHALKDAPRSFAFTTLRPEVLGGSTEAFSSLGVVALGDRVYTVENSSPHGKIRVFDIGTDPSAPVQVAETYLSGMPSHIAGENESPVTGGRVVAALATLMVLRGPSNLWIYDASTDAPQRIGAVSLTESTEQGIALRVAVKGRYAYAWTFPLGLRVIDLVRAREVFAQANADPNLRTRMYGDLVTSGRGFGSEAIVNTIAVPSPAGGTAHIFGLKVDDYFLDGLSQPLMIATGSLPLVVANPQTMQSWRYESLTGPDGISLTWGWSLALARVADKPVAVVVGKGTARDGGEWVLATVDLTNPRDAKLLGTFKLAAQPMDVVVSGNLALVAAGDHIVTVNIGDLANPTHAGDIPNIGGRLALAEGGILVSTATGASTAGLRTAALGSFAVVHSVSPSPIPLDENGRTTADLEVTYQMVNPPATLASGSLIIRDTGGLSTSVPLPDLRSGIHTLTVPRGVQFQQTPQTVELTLVRPDGTETLPWVLSRGALEAPFEEDAAVSTPTALSDVAALLEAPALDFEMITPNVVDRGAASADVTLSSAYFPNSATVVVRRAGEAWTSMPTVPVDEGSRITLPGTLLDRATFLHIAPSVTEENTALVFLVADPTLPDLDTAPEIILLDNRLRTTDGDTNELTVDGQGFRDGMKIVLGRGETPGFTLETTFISSFMLRAEIPAQFLARGEDLFVAVLLEDSTRLSPAMALDPEGKAFLVTGEADGGLAEEEERDYLNQFDEEDVELTGVRVTGGGALELDGVGLANGLTLKFRTTNADGSVVVTTSQLEDVVEVEPPATTAVRGAGIAASATAATEECYEVKHAPKRTTGRASTNLPARPRATAQVTAQTQSGQTQVVSPQRQTPRLERAEIPFGGRVAFGVYEEKATKTLAILTAHDFTGGGYSRADYDPKTALAASITSNDSDNRYLQIERDAAAGFIHVRGVGLNRKPDQTAVTNVKTLSVTFEGKTATREVAVVYRTLGAQKEVPTPDGPVVVDKVVALLADEYRLDPVLLKAQVEQESSFIYNFRYESSTIDMIRLSAGGTRRDQALVGSTARALTEPWVHYLLEGKIVNPRQAEITETAGGAWPNFTMAHFARRRRNAFATETPREHNARSQARATENARLQAAGEPLLAAVPLWGPAEYARRKRQERDAGVSAEIYNGTTLVQRLEPVHCDAIWRRVEWQDGESDPGVTPNEGEFCVFYREKRVLVGGNRGLAEGERLVLRYTPVGEDYAGSLTSVSRGDLVRDGSAAFFKDENYVRPGSYSYDSQSQAPCRRTVIKYREGDKIREHFLRNMTHSMTQPIVEPEYINYDRFGRFLRGTTSDPRIEFELNAAGHPTIVRDPKMDYITAQYWASSSYGPLQMTLLPWLGGPRAADLNSILNVDQRSVMELLTDYQTGVRLGAKFDQTLRNQQQQPSSFTNATWEAMWRRVLTAYNGDAAYARHVFDKAAAHQPQ